jgi:hypothetical protein
MGVSGGPYIVRDSSLVLDIDPADRNSVISGSNFVYNLTSMGGSGSWNQPQNMSYSSSYINITNLGNYTSNINNLTGSTFPQSSGSVSIWFNMNKYDQQPTLPFFDQWDNTRNHFFIRHGSSYQIQLGAQKNSATEGYQAVFAENSLQVGSWYNMVFTYVTGNSSSYKYYLNGVLRGSTTFASSSWTPSDQWVGYGSVQSLTIATGSYGPLQIYSRDLTQQEILQNYNALKSRFNL